MLHYIYRVIFGYGY